MSSNHSSAIEFQRPLFDGYEIGVEFEKRWQRLDALIAATSTAEESANVVKRLIDEFCICPLELSSDSVTLEVIPSGRMRGTGEPVYEYIYRIPFQGDPELWSLRSPQPMYLRDLRPEGEIYRGDVTISFLVITREEAEGLFATAIHELRMAMDAQATDVGSFNHALPALIWRKLMQKRTGCYVPHCPETRH